MTRLRKWAARVGALRISADPANPTVSIQLSKVDVDAILGGGANEDNPGNRRRKIRELLFVLLGFEAKDGLFVRYEFVWRGTRRTVEVAFTNVREVPDEGLWRRGTDCQVVLDFPFDVDQGSVADDIARLDRFRGAGETSPVLCWLPAFFSPRARTDLGRLVVIEHILTGERFGQLTRDLAEVDRASARADLENLKSGLKDRLALDLETRSSRSARGGQTSRPSTEGTGATGPGFLRLLHLLPGPSRPHRARSRAPRGSHGGAP